MTPVRITNARIDALQAKLARVQADIDKMRLGDTRAADRDRIIALRSAHISIDGVKRVLEDARPVGVLVGEVAGCVECRGVVPVGELSGGLCDACAMRRYP